MDESEEGKNSDDSGGIGFPGSRKDPTRARMTLTRAIATRGWSGPANQSWFPPCRSAPTPNQCCRTRCILSRFVVAFPFPRFFPIYFLRFSFEPRPLTHALMGDTDRNFRWISFLLCSLSHLSCLHISSGIVAHILFSSLSFMENSQVSEILWIPRLKRNYWVNAGWVYPCFLKWTIIRAPKKSVVDLTF